MKVKEMKKMLEGKDDKKNIVFLSTSGIAWDINKNVQENFKDEEEQIVIYIT